MNGFDRIDDECSRRAWGLAYALTRNAADADDVMQQAFIVAWKRSSQVPAEPWPWFAAVVANCARNQKRGAARRRNREAAMLQEKETSGRAFEASLEQSELRRLLLNALDELPPEEREAVALCHVGGLTQQQASEATGVNLNTIKARVSRGLARMKARLASRSASIEVYLASMALPVPAEGYEAALRRWRDGATGGSAGAAVSGASFAAAACALGLAAMLFTAWVLVEAGNSSSAEAPGGTASGVMFDDAADASSSLPMPVGQPPVGQPVVRAESADVSNDSGGVTAPAADVWPEKAIAQPNDTLVPAGPNPVGSMQVRISYYPTGEKYMQWTEQVTQTGAIRQGSFSAFFTSGIVCEAGEYVDNDRQGSWTRYHENGAMASRAEFRGGRLNGTFRSFYDDGTPEAEGSYTDSMRSGTWTFWHANGQRQRVATFHEDLPDGLMTDFDEQGRKRRETVWTGGVKQYPPREFDENGNELPPAAQTGPAPEINPAPEQN